MQAGAGEDAARASARAGHGQQKLRKNRETVVTTEAPRHRGLKIKACFLCLSVPQWCDPHLFTPVGGPRYGGRAASGGVEVNTSGWELGRARGREQVCFSAAYEGNTAS